MCQAYEAEAASIRAGEAYETRKGWIAHRDGQPVTANPNFSGYYKEAWDHGWRCREEGIIPWSIVSRYRDKIEKETGKACYLEPSVQEADTLA